MSVECSLIGSVRPEDWRMRMATKKTAARSGAKKKAATKKTGAKKASTKKAPAKKKSAAKGGGRFSAVSVIGRIARGVGHAIEDVAKGAAKGAVEGVAAVVSSRSAGKGGKATRTPPSRQDEGGTQQAPARSPAKRTSRP
jgi:hypothetical protein